MQKLKKQKNLDTHSEGPPCFLIQRQATLWIWIKAFAASHFSIDRKGKSRDV